jgi:hypothetical protein
MRSAAAFLLCLGLVSCEGKYGEYPPYPVSGQVLVNGKPAYRAVLVFHLDNYKGERAIAPQAITDQDGRFVVSTYGNNDGAPAGDYHVGVRWSPDGIGIRNLQDKLKGKYQNAFTSGLTAHVEKGKNELKPFELQVDENAIEPSRQSNTKIFKAKAADVPKAP